MTRSLDPCLLWEGSVSNDGYGRIGKRPVEVVLMCGDCGRDFHARASRWVVAS